MRPLDGITVVSLEQAVAAPFASRHLADLGARVIKIERPQVGDFARDYDQTVNGLSSHFVWLNRSKESLALDVKHAKAKEILDKLIARADVFIQNLAPGAAGRLGLSAEELLSEHPRLIVCDISGYGDSGPYASKKAYDLLVQSEAGVLSVTGTPETPSKVGISIADIATGVYAYSGILAALLQREKTGKGGRVEVTMLEALGEWMGYPLYYTHFSGAAPPRTGPDHATIVPYGRYLTGDGKSVMLGLQNEREWAAFCDKVLGLPRLAADSPLRQQFQAQPAPRGNSRDHRQGVLDFDDGTADREAGRGRHRQRAHQFTRGSVEPRAVQGAGSLARDGLAQGEAAGAAAARDARWLRGAHGRGSGSRRAHGDDPARARPHQRGNCRAEISHCDLVRAAQAAAEVSGVNRES